MRESQRDLCSWHDMMMMMIYVYIYIYIYRERERERERDQFLYLGSNISSTESDVNKRISKTQTDLSDKIKWESFPVIDVSLLLYGCTTWTLTKEPEKNLDGNHSKMLPAITNKTWKQYHLPPILQNIQVRWELPGKSEQTHNQHSTMDSFVWTHQCWPTFKYWHWSAWCRHKMLSRGLAKNDDQ